MMKLLGVLSGVLLIAPSPAPAIWMRSASVEWWTNLADEIVLVEVIRAKELEPLNEYHFSRELGCRKKEGLRGSSVEEWTFRHDFHRTGKVDRGVEAGDELLLFVFREPKSYHQNPVFWVSLTRPHPSRATHAAHDNNARHLATKDEILKTVRSRLTGEDAKRPARKRGVIVMMPETDIYWDFVRTADLDLKPVLMKELSSDWREGRCSAIHNLISYPDAETVKVIRAKLNDPEAVVWKAGEKNESIRYYPVRQAAYLALTLLGEEVEKPKPYIEDYQPLLFSIGLDNSSYFPYGDWKRISK